MTCVPNHPIDDWPIMRDTPRSGSITLGSVLDPSPTRAPSRRPILIYVALGAVALVAVGVGLGFALSGGDPPPAAVDTTPQVAEPATPSPSPSPQFRAGKVGQPFEIAPWRITVTSIKCGTAHDLLAENDDNGQKPTDRVCVAAISYTNIDKAPHDYGSGFDTANPSPVDTFLGFAGEAAYVGHKWAAQTVNPGLTQTNALIFGVPAGVALDAVQIGDVLVKALP